MNSGPAPQLPWRLRRSARVLLFDSRGDLFLIRFIVQREGGSFIFWVTPGGEVEPGESDHAAAGRELFEELGLRLQLAGPVHQESGGTYVHLGETVRNFDVFFAAVCDRGGPVLKGVTADEIALMHDTRWWTLAEIETAQERIYPVQLAAIAREVMARWSSEIGLIESDL